jgi:C4-dicarboxylate-specific signal transduction histidine kinase
MKNLLTDPIRRWLRRSISNRITLAAVTLVAAVTTLILVAGMGTTRWLIENNLLDTLAGQAALSSNRIASAIDAMGQDIRGLSSNPLVLNSLNDNEWREIYLRPFLRDFRKSPQAGHAIHLIASGSGELIASNHFTNPDRLSALPWISSNLAGEGARIEIIDDTIGLILRLAIHVRPPGSGITASGWLIGEVSLTRIFYEEARYYQNNSLILFSDQRPILEWNRKATSSDNWISHTQPVVIDEIFGKQQLNLLLSEDASHLDRVLALLTLSILVIFLITLLFSYLWARLIAGRLTRPLAVLDAVANEVSHSGLLNESQPVDFGGEDEVASLASSFSRMLEALRSAQRNLEQRVERRTSELNRAKLQIEHDYQIQKAISSILSNSLEPIALDQKLERALDIILSIPWFMVHESGCIYLTDEHDPHILVMRVQRGLAGELLKSCSRLPFGRCLCGMAAVTRAPVYRSAVDDDHEIKFEGMEPHGHICIPIQINEQILGVINLYTASGASRPDSEIGFLSAIADVLASTIIRDQAADQERRLQNQVAHISRLTTMGEMATTLSHELNQPLAAIVNFAGGSLRRIDNNRLEPESQRYALNKISEQAKVAGEILRRIRSFVGKGGHTVHQGLIDLHEVINESLALAELPLRQNSIVVERHFSPIDSQVCADRIQIQQVLVNLIMNAIDALTANGKQQRLLTVTTREDGSDGALIEVSDNGPPFTGQPEQLFQPFFTTKQSGLGMGLAICATIIEAHRGRIRAIANQGGGLTIAITLPTEVPSRQ